MTIEQIKAAVTAGKTVHWKDEDYEVTEDAEGRFLVECSNGTYDMLCDGHAASCYLGKKDASYTPGKLSTTTGDDEDRYIVSDESVLIADCYADTHIDLGLPDYNEASANAKRLVHCWNCHDELVEALEDCLRALTDETDGVKRREYDASVKASDILAKAKAT